MLERIKRGICYIIIILLLPYILTVFLNGSSITTYSHVDGTYIKVRPENSERQKEKLHKESSLEDVDAKDSKKTADDGENSNENNGENAEGESAEGEEDTIDMSIEDYCIGVMARCIPVTYKEEALKAQAVSVRSLTFRKIRLSAGKCIFEGGYWTEKQMEEAWGMKYAVYHHKLEKAWNDTEGQVLYYGEDVALTPYFRLSNGTTRDAKEALGSEDYPYLKMVECPLDVESKEELKTRTFDDLKAEVKETDSAGYVLSVQAGEETVNGEEFRNAYDLDSSCFTLQDYDGKLRITTRGVGHGLGMSQYTANRMAKEGKDYKEILDYFFSGTEIKEVTEILKSTE